MIDFLPALEWHVFKIQVTKNSAVAQVMTTRNDKLYL